MALLVFHIYAHSKDGPFVFDDLSNILDNSHIRVSSLDWQSLREAAFASPSATRPVVNLTFALDYYIHQYEPLGYRLVNVLIHLTNGFLLLFFLRATLRTPVLRDQYRNFYRLLPFAAVTIWLVNPLHTQSISYIVQRMNPMATMFYLLSFLLYVRARLAEGAVLKWLSAGGAFLAFLLAIGSKEHTVTLPFFVFLYEWYFFRDLDRGWLKRNCLWLGAILCFWLGMFYLYTGSSPIAAIISSYHGRDFTMTHRLLTQFRVVIFYFGLLIFPHPSRLNLDHYFPLSQSLLDPPTTLLAVLLIGGVIGLATATARKERLLSFCVFWFLGNLVVESSVIGLEIIFEHRTYLPSTLISVILVIVVCRLVRHKWLRGLILAGMVAIGVVWTHERNLVWADDVALWADSLQKAPGKVRPHVNLGLAYKERGQLEKAIDYLREAVLLEPAYQKARYNLSNVFLHKGEFTEAERHAAIAVRLDPGDVDSRNVLGIAQARQGKLGPALDNFSEAVRLNPHNAESHYNFSLALANSGGIDQSIRHCMEALRIKPDYPAARNHLRKLRRQIKEPKFAKEEPFSGKIAILP
ncbi:MAG: tetratricopeptide repeat protein [Desulfobulbales bacterium]|nr:tetratricopeptide repeat protein [Desulfobulbales bacterium]